MVLKGTRFRLVSSGSGYRPAVGSTEHCNESFISIKDGKFLDQVRDY
jgi:hypothetical protein